MNPDEIEPNAAPPADPDPIKVLFTYHAPTPEQVESYKRIREAGEHLARVVFAECPGGPDRTASIRKVRESVMTANASIATNNAALNVR